MFAKKRREKKTMKERRIIAAALLLSLCTASIGGCTKKAEDGGEGLSSKINVDGNNVNVIDEMEDWQGKKMNLVYWFSNGDHVSIGKKAQNTVVRDELTRVTGISWDEKKSFDNNGESTDAKISKIIATDTWPDVAYNLDVNIMTRLGNNDKIWDLTEYIPKYMDNYMKLVNSDEYTKKSYEDLKVDGKMWYWMQAAGGAAKYMNDSYSESDYQNLITPEETRAWIWVRDDILKTLYPNAKSQSEIKQMYLDKGEFSKEDLTDVTIGGYDELREFLEKINALGLTENGRKVWPFYTHDGGDNWNLLTQFNGIEGAPLGMANYFSYYDVKTKKMVRTIDQDWFKKQMKFYNELINDGLAAKEALVDNKASFDQKKNNGEYAVFYGNDIPPTDEALKAAGKNFSYRKVLIDVPIDHSRFIKPNTSNRVFDGVRWTIFKTNNIKTEQDLEQVLRYIDFFYSEAGQKFSYWGPEKAGLYTVEADGTMKYTDEGLEQNLVYDNGNDALIKYGFNSWPPAAYEFRVFASKYNPKVVYMKRGERSADQYLNAWRYSTVEAPQNYPDLKVNFNLWNWSPYVDKVKGFWDSRTSIEEAVKLVFTSQNDEEFEKYYRDMVNAFEKNGLTAETMDEVNKAFKEVNADYIETLENWKPEER